MPGFDGTGPIGQGTMTGRRMGFCAPTGLSNNYASGRIFGCGRGRGIGLGLGYGRGRGRFLPDATVQKNYLQNMVGYLQDELASVKEEIDRLEKTAEKDIE